MFPEPEREIAPWATPMQAHARTTDPETSHEAAASVTPKIRASQEAVHAFLLWYGPATDEEWMRAYVDPLEGEVLLRPAPPERPYQSPSGLRSRRAELVVLKRVVDTGERERLASGRRAIVWRAVP